MRIGFTQGCSGGCDVYKDYNIGKPGHYGVGQITATGVLKEINYEGGYLLIQPSIVGYGNLMRVEEHRPTIIQIIPGQPIIIRPLEDEDLERIVADVNSNNHKNSR